MQEDRVQFQEHMKDEHKGYVRYLLTHDYFDFIVPSTYRSSGPIV